MNLTWCLIRIDLADKRTACFTVAGYLKVVKGVKLLECEIDCCTGRNCNTQTPTLSQAAIPLFSGGNVFVILVTSYAHKSPSFPLLIFTLSPSPYELHLSAKKMFSIRRPTPPSEEDLYYIKQD